MRSRACLAIGCLLLLGRAVAAAEVRPDHPRVYLNKDSLPEIKRRCEGPNKPIYEKMKAAVDALIAKPAKANRIKGVDASMPAFCFLMTGDRQYVEYARKLLDQKIEGTEWEAAALDWLHGQLSRDEFRAYAQKLLATGWKLHSFENNTPWWNQTYTWRSGLDVVSAKALAIYGEGVDDAKAAACVQGLGRFLRETFLEPTNVTGAGWPEGPSYFEGMCVGDAITLGLAAWKSATGEDLFRESRFLKGVAEWFLYITVPHAAALPMVCDGSGGDITPGRIASQLLAHEYGDPFSAAAARRGYDFGLKQASRNDPEFRYYHYHVMPLVLWGDPGRKPVEAEKLPPARLYAPIGWVTMRSDWSPNATYALLKLGRWFTGHQHMDAGSFIITHRGHLAIDSGAYSTYSQPETDHAAYYRNAIAHNTTAIANPHPLKYGWALDKTGVRDYGGQHDLSPAGFAMPQQKRGHIEKGSPWDTCDLLAHEANGLFTYVAADVSGAYRPELLGGQKILEKFTRQFVYLRPGLFIVYDRVTTTDPKYTKRFLLHLMAEPKMAGKRVGEEKPFALYDGDSYAAFDGEGQLTVRRLLPKEAVFRVVGGDGFEFWANGKQHPISEGWYHLKEFRKQGKWEPKLTVGWGRVETEPRQAAATDHFLHVLLASDLFAKKAPMPACELIERDGHQGVRVAGYGGRDFELLFAAAGPPAGRIEVKQGPRVLASRAFTTEVKEDFEPIDQPAAP